MPKLLGFEAFTESPKKVCGHLHKTARLAAGCALKNNAQHGGTWFITSVVKK